MLNLFLMFWRGQISSFSKQAVNLYIIFWRCKILRLCLHEVKSLHYVSRPSNFQCKMNAGCQSLENDFCWLSNFWQVFWQSVGLIDVAASTWDTTVWPALRHKKLTRFREYFPTINSSTIRIFVGKFAETFLKWTKQSVRPRLNGKIELMCTASV